MAYGGHHRIGEHDQRDMPVPTMPRSCFVVIEAEFVLSGLKPFLDPPAGSFDLDQGIDRGSLGTPCGEVGHITISGVAPDEQTACPQAGSILIVVRRIKIGQFTIGPIVKTFTFGPPSGGEPLSGFFR